MVAAVMRSVGLALLWALVALLSITFTRHESDLSLVWPANAIITAMLLIEPRSRRAGHVAAVFGASLLFNLWAGASPFGAILFSLLSMMEAVLAAWMIARLSPAARPFDAPGNVFRFAIVSILACVPSAVATALLLQGHLASPQWMVAGRWLAAHGCGLLIMTPLLLILHDSQRSIRARRTINHAALWRGLAMFGLVAAVTTLVFRQTTYAMSFLIVPALLVATFHMRARGAAGSVVIIALIASWFTIEGNGPFAMMNVTVGERAYLAQAFVATMFLCALPLAAVLDERDELADRTAAHLAAIRGIADRIGDVLFRIDDRDCWAYVNPAYHAITGRSASGAIGRTIFSDLPERDHARLRHGLRRLRAGEIQQYGFTSEIVDALGGTRHVEFTMHAQNFAGLADGLSGVFRDVTARTLLDCQLRDAASSALRDARTDPLTRLSNRRAFFEHAETLIESGGTPAVALFDIDHFKRINDSFGHPAGDEVLRHIAATASTHLREGDMIARIGGEEFALLIVDEDPAAAVLAGERLVHGIGRQNICLPAALTGASDDIDLQVTISMGLARLTPGQSVQELLAEADRALYAAKNGGRNQLRLAA